MTDRVPPDPPTGADLARVRAARRTARAAVNAATTAHALAMEAAFRGEMTTTVRSVSPFLTSLATLSGLTLEDVAKRMTPRWGWPDRPRLSDVAPGWPAVKNLQRQVAASPNARRRSASRGPGGPHAGGFRVKPGGWAKVRLIVHSLEVSLTIGALTFESLFGELLIHIRGGLPLTLAAGAAGRPIEDFVMHPATNGRGWTIGAVETRGMDSVLVVATGSLLCELP